MYLIMNHKKIKPNLLDESFKIKMIKTLNPPKEDYWGPTRNIFTNFYKNYLKPHILLIIFIILIVLFLVYRYRHNKKTPTDNSKNKSEHFETNGQVEQLINKYSTMTIDAYNQQKEILREPKFSKNNLTKRPAQLAYPLYPYVKGGTLLPSGKR